MGGVGFIFVLIVVILTVVGAISQALKNAQAAAPPARGARPANPRAAAGEIDRFLEEIDRLRKKKAGEQAPNADEPPVARPVAERRKRPVARPVAKPAPEPVAEPVRSRRVEQVEAPPPPTVLPQAPRIEELPPPVSPPPPARITTPPPPRSRGQQSDFGKALAGLLATKQGLPLAVVLQEVLGPPKGLPGRDGR